MLSCEPTASAAYSCCQCSPCRATSLGSLPASGAKLPPWRANDAAVLTLHSACEACPPSRRALALRPPSLPASIPAVKSSSSSSSTPPAQPSENRSTSTAWRMAVSAGLLVADGVCAANSMRLSTVRLAVQSRCTTLRCCATTTSTASLRPPSLPNAAMRRCITGSGPAALRSRDFRSLSAAVLAEASFALRASNASSFSSRPFSKPTKTAPAASVIGSSSSAGSTCGSTQQMLHGGAVQ